MYSKYKGITERDYSLTPPPGYDGSRFRRRSDGRDDAFPLYGGDVERPPKQSQIASLQYRTSTCDCENEAQSHICPVENSEQDCIIDKSECCQEEPPCCTEYSDNNCVCQKSAESSPKSSKIMSFLHGLGHEEILLISLILLLAGGNSRAETDTILILALLLCVT